eukprot:GGOE01015456.1.p1 GENE.GGOE01015456.1~~GGOE01015456.1.p1  ORF type:complete len:352 (-),score=71.77 GGOE01015456.1:141-1118(-)
MAAGQCLLLLCVLAALAAMPGAAHILGESQAACHAERWTSERLAKCMQRAVRHRVIDPDCLTNCTLRKIPTSPAPIERLMVVAHADDETIFGGVPLLRRGGWRVLCATCAVEERWRTFQKAVEYAGAIPERLSLPDVEFGPIPGLRAATARLTSLIRLHSFSEVVTHSPLGEYGHTAHKQVFKMVCQAMAGRPFHVFTAHHNATVPPEVAGHLFRMLTAHRNQFSVISGFLAMSVHQSVRRCEPEVLHGRCVCPLPPALQQEEDRIHRPPRIVEVIALRHNYKWYRQQGYTRDEIRRICAADAHHCTHEPPETVPRGRRPLHPRK